MGCKKRPLFTAPVLSASAKDPICQDKLEKCSLWAKSQTKEGHGYCKRFPFIKRYCKKSCGLCPGEYSMVSRVDISKESRKRWCMPVGFHYSRLESTLHGLIFHCKLCWSLFCFYLQFLTFISNFPPGNFA